MKTVYTPWFVIVIQWSQPPHRWRTNKKFCIDKRTVFYSKKLVSLSACQHQLSLYTVQQGWELHCNNLWRCLARLSVFWPKNTRTNLLLQLADNPPLNIYWIIYLTRRMWEIKHNITTWHLKYGNPICSCAEVNVCTYIIFTYILVDGRYCRLLSYTIISSVQLSLRVRNRTTGVSTPPLLHRISAINK